MASSMHQPGAPLSADPWRDRAASENFPVALRVLPTRLRRRLEALYAVARTIDEIGDSADGDRTAQLQAYRAQITSTWAGQAPRDPALALLAPVIAECGLSRAPFDRLIDANLQDQVVASYATIDDLIDYCHASADPVGETVLEIFGQADPDSIALSDRVCTALQFVEHWQDVGEDRRAGRIYLPREDMERFGVTETDLDAAVAGEPLRSLIRFETDRAAELLDAGTALLGRLDGWARLCVAGFIAGGQATVAALREADGEVLGRSVSPSRLRTVGILGRLMLQRGGVR